MSDEFIKKALGIGSDFTPKEDLKPVVLYQSVEEEHIDTSEAEKDIDFARDNTIELIAQSSEAIAELLMIAKQSQHPRAFEVVATLLKTSSDLNSDLVALHKKKQDLCGTKESSKNPRVPGSVTNNNLFVGSTAELQRMIADMAKKTEE